MGPNGTISSGHQSPVLQGYSLFGLVLPSVVVGPQLLWMQWQVRLSLGLASCKARPQLLWVVGVHESPLVQLAMVLTAADAGMQVCRMGLWYS